MTTAESEHSKQSILEQKEFLYAIGLALGLMLGLAMGYWVSYTQSLNYAAQAVSDFIKMSPLDCRIAMGYANETMANVPLSNFVLLPNGSVTWKDNTPQPN